MKRKTVRTLLLFLALFLIALAALVAYTLKDDPLNPMAEKALHYQPSSVPPEKNAFVGIAGLDAPAGSDFIAAGEKNIRANLSPQKGSAAQKRYSCEQEITENCLVEIRAEAQNIQRLLAENGELIQRYLHIQAMPEFSHSFAKMLKPGTVQFSLNYGKFLNLSRLLSAKAVLDIQNGRIEEGLGFIEKDMNFYRGILASQDINLLDMMIAIRQIQRYANLLILLFNEERFSRQTDRMRALLKPLDTPEKTFANALWIEQAFMTQLLFRGLITDLEKPPEMMVDFKTGRIRENTYLDRLKFMLFVKPNMSLNLYNEFSRVEIDTINALTTEVLPAQPGALWENEVRPRVCIVPKDYFFCRHWKNYLGEFLVYISFSDNVRYLFRIHDVDARLRLFRARLEFARAAKNAPKAETPEAILARLGPETFNPYTGQPFEWNPETGMIGFMPAGDENPKRVEVRLHFSP
ncbi:MAG: hypothetical protein LBU11_05635 [Zoogloeaceae bacterium]|jgi:tetratricopeptide (TPR) repeat protein|nr:hypothetical protein [Zoogloeaceae bacterium]